MRLLTNHSKEVFTKSKEIGEKKDCSVKAVAIATGVSYSTAHKACAANGRMPHYGMHDADIIRTIKDLGFVVGGRVYVRKNNGHSKYTTSTIGQALPTGTYLVFVNGHVLTLSEGEVYDWTKGRRFRVNYVLKVEAPILKPSVDTQNQPAVSPKKKANPVVAPTDAKRVAKPVAFIWSLCHYYFDTCTRKEILDIAIAEGVNVHTARRQYQEYKTFNQK